MENALATFTTEIEQRMERFGWSRNRLAKEAKVDPATLSRIWNGTQKITHEFVAKIASALDVDSAYLAELAGLPTITPPVKRDPAVEYLAQKLDALPDKVRGEAIDALGAQLDVIYRLTKLNAESLHFPLPLHLAEKIHALNSEDTVTEAELRELKAIAPDTYYRFLEDQLGPNWRELVKGVAEIEAALDSSDEKDRVPANRRKAVR